MGFFIYTGLTDAYCNRVKTGSSFLTVAPFGLEALLPPLPPPETLLVVGELTTMFGGPLFSDTGPVKFLFSSEATEALFANSFAFGI